MGNQTSGFKCNLIWRLEVCITDKLRKALKWKKSLNIFIEIFTHTNTHNIGNASEIVRNEFFRCNFVKVQAFCRFWIVFIVVLYIDEKFSSTPLLKQPHKGGLKSFHIIRWYFMNLKKAYEFMKLIEKWLNNENVYWRWLATSSKPSLVSLTDLSFVVHITAIDSLEIQILGNICVDENTNQSTIGHHKLQKIEMKSCFNRKWNRKWKTHI